MSQAPKEKNFGLIFAVLIGCLLAFLAPAMFVLLLVGMAPTWVAVFAERHNAGRVHTMAALNIAGVLPFLGQVWSSNGGMTTVSALLGNVYTWAVMYGSAGMGVAFLWLGPQIAALYLDFKAAHYSRQLQKQKESLIEEWGQKLEEAGDESSASAGSGH